MTEFWKSIPAWPSAILKSLFTPQPQGKMRFAAAAWIVFLYLLGAYWFGVFFNWGDHTLFFQDWADITGPRTEFLRTAVKSGQLPLHISDPSTMHGNTIRYLTVPDTLISPQILLLARFSIQRFNYINVLLFYTLGFAGLLALRRKFHLSIFALAVLTLLFNFNGDLLAHFSVGHMTWIGTFLFPWFALLIFRLLEGDHSWKWIFWMSSLMAVIWLQGSFHQFLWLLIFLGLIGLFVPGCFWMIVRSGFFVLLLSAFRILPSIMLVGKYGASYISGYPTFFSLWDSLINITNLTGTYFYFPPGYEGVSPWETANFIGILGTIFMLYFGLVRGMLVRQAPFQKLLLPLGGMLLLSMGQFFGYLRMIPIPLIQGERVGTRIISVVLVFLFIFAAERLQRWLDSSAISTDAEPPSLNSTGILPAWVLQGSLLLAFSMEMMELWINLKTWSIPNAVKEFWWVYYDVDKWYVKNNWADTTYLALVFGGLALSLITFAALALIAWRRSRKVET